MTPRERLFEIIEVGEARPLEEMDLAGRAYDIFMIVAIFASIIPLAVKEQTGIYLWIDRITLVIFIVDYVVRLATADLKLRRGKRSFLMYPLTPMAIVDLIAILPSLTLLHGGVRVVRIVRLFRVFRAFRVFKAFRYSKNVAIIINVFRKQKDSLMVVGMMAGAYILISALILFDVEPQTFSNFFQAIYWATVSLTTVGYGDIYAVTVAGKIITMLSSVFGVAVVALPAGIITAGYMEELREMKSKKEKEEQEP